MSKMRSINTNNNKQLTTATLAVIISLLIGTSSITAFTTTTTTATATTASSTSSFIKNNDLFSTTNSRRRHGQQHLPLQPFSSSTSSTSLFMSSEVRSPSEISRGGTEDTATVSTPTSVGEEEENDPDNSLLEAVVQTDPISGIVMSNTNADGTQNNKNQLLDTVVFANGSVLAFVGVAILYSLFHTHIEALLALWEYDLGKLDSPELTKMAVAVEVMLRLPVDWLHAYEELVPQNPIFYKACTSGVAYCLGDFISQIYQGSTLKTLDLPRSLRSGAAGFIGHGPLCHYWLLFMETYLDFDGAWWATGIKVTADLTIWATFLNTAYSFIIGILAFRKPQDVFEDIKATSWPALRSAWRFWPFVHTISFSHAVPLDLKLLWVDVMEVVWVTILSKVANEDKNARLDANPELQSKDVSKDIPEVDPALEIELTREAEIAGFDKKKLAFELPQKAFAACWPLIVMWPILYGGYQIEKLLGFEV